MSSAPRLEIDVSVECDGWSAVPDAESLAITAITAAARGAGHQLLAGAEVSILLTDDAQVRELNRIWRQQDKPTNVLSFPATQSPSGHISSAHGADLSKAHMLGDIVVALETVQREALSEGKTLPDHLTHLIIHGFLHLLGYDHHTDEDAERMENLERRVLASLGIANPYDDKS